jgi:NitT/TauT family transport system permease protein
LSQAPTAALRHSRPLADRRGAVVAGQLALLAAIFLAWEATAAARWINPDLGGQPSAMWRLFVASAATGELWGHLKVTLYEQLVGFAVGTVAGVAIGLGLWWSRTASRVLEPFAVIFNGIPKIALAPPMIVWFGIYETSKIVLAATICVVVAWLAAHAGARMADRDLLDMVRAMGGSRWQAFTMIVVPSSMSWIISALKVNIGFALVGAVVGEFVASNHGLGYLAVQAAISFQMSQLWMVVFVIMAVAAAQYVLVLWLERRLLARMGGEEQFAGRA